MRGAANLAVPLDVAIGTGPIGKIDALEIDRRSPRC
jgi:hypothetical protein